MKANKNHAWGSMYNINRAWAIIDKISYLNAKDFAALAQMLNYETTEDCFFDMLAARDVILKAGLRMDEDD